MGEQALQRRRVRQVRRRLEVHAHEEQPRRVVACDVAELLRVDDVAAGLEQQARDGINDALGVAARQREDEFRVAMAQALPRIVGMAHTGRAMKTDPNDWSDRSRELQQLLARRAMGDRPAFARLYELTSGHLFAVVRRIQRDRTLAEDLLQEVYVNVWQAAGGFDAVQGQPLTWLTSIARNRAIDSLRRTQTQPQTQSTTRDDDEPDRPTRCLTRARGRWTCCHAPRKLDRCRAAWRYLRRSSGKAWRWRFSTGCRMPRWPSTSASRWAP